MSSLCRRCAQTLLLFAVAGTAALAAPLQLYVAPNGNDTWSGRFVSPLPGGTDGPLATPQGARDRIRALRANPGITTPVNVNFREGTYRLTAPLTLEHQDSGTAANPITFMASPGEIATLSGGRVVTGWTAEGPLWKAQLPQVISDGWRFAALFAGGELRLPARTPNWDGRKQSLNNASFLRASAPIAGQHDSIQLVPSDIPSFTNPGDVIYMFVHAWDTSYHRIASANRNTGVVQFLPNYPGFAVFDHFDFGTWDPQQPYCIYHAKEALDAPGEWWLDTVTGTLYYYPKPGDIMNTTEVVAPVTQRMVTISGDGANPVEYVNFHGLRFEHGNYVFGPGAPQSLYNAVGNTLGPNILPGAFLADGLQHSVIDNCRFAQMAAYAVELRKDCANVSLVQNEMTELGAGGLVVGKDLTTTNHDNIIDNNWIHDGGILFPGTIALRLGRTSHNDVTHNEVSDFYMSGLSVGDSLGYDPSTAFDNVVADNHVHHIGGGMLSDMGGIYTTGISTGTEIRHNHVHDVYYAPGGYGGWGIYLDEGSSNLTISDNLVHSTASGGFHLHYGRDNLVENNIFAWSENRQIERTDVEPLQRESLNVQGNIFYFTNGLAFAGNWSDKKFRFDNNVYWSVTHDDFVFPFGSFTDWQTQGFDVHGKLLDPLFADGPGYDFTLSNSSPAVTQAGFVPFDTTTFGLYGSAAWVNGPKSIVRLPTPLPRDPEEVQYFYNFENTDVGELPDELFSFGTTAQATVGVTTDQAANGSRSLRLHDASGLANLWDPHAYLRPNFRNGFAVERFRIRMSTNAYLFHDWRDQVQSGYTLGPSISIDGDGLKILGVLQESFPRNVWCQVEVKAALGDTANGHFTVRVWKPGSGWSPEHTGNFGTPEFSRIAWIGLMSYSNAADDIYIDDYELYDTTPSTDSDHDGIPDAVEGLTDADHDTIPNYVDLDSDSDGVTDANEYFGNAAQDDPDHDGLWNAYDPDSDNDGVSDGIEYAAGSDALDPASKPAYHTADTEPDNHITLQELLRVIQFYNTGSLHCDAGTEDGFAPGPGAQDCAHHDSDYAPANWKVSLAELSRAIQYFNIGGYHACPGGEDGFCPGFGP